MAANIKLGVDMTAFKQGINEAKAQIKAFDAQLKVAETTFKKTGDAEAAMSTKTDALTNKLKTQKQMVRQYEEALARMRAKEVDPMSESYKQMEAAMLNMQSAANETEIALNGLSTSQLTAASSADKLTQSVNGIGKKISLDQVISGIDKITGGLENAAKKAVDLGEHLWNNIMNKAQWADDTATMAMMYGIDLDTFLRMQKLVTNGLDTSVDAILSSQSKLKRGIGSDAKAVSDALNEMGIAMTTYVGGGKYGPIEQAKDSLELFWEVGQKLMTWGDEYQKEDMAQKLFGRGWKELVPLFKDYKSLEEYNAALQKVNVNSEEDVNALAELNDKVGQLKGNLEKLSTDILAKLAPALSQGADALNGMLTKLMEYLETPDGQAMLERLGTAVSGLFEDLGKIDPEKTTQAFVELFTKVTDGIQWLVENKETAKGILGAIVGAWGTLKLTEGVLNVVKLVDGIKSLTGLGAAEGAAAGASWGGAFASAVLKAAPWLIGLITLLNPAGTDSGEFISAEGKITDAGRFEFAQQGWDNPEYRKILMELGGIYGADQLRGLIKNDAAVAAIWTYLFSGHQGSTQDFARNVLSGYTGGITFSDGKSGVNFTEEELKKILSPYLTPEFVIPEDAALKISEQIGVIPVAVQPVVPNDEPEYIPGGGGGGNNVAMEKANGIWSVPYDGYLARLHKYERVMPAREVSSRNFSSNLYVESMIMNNGADAAGLAASMAAAQRRTMTGFGS